MPRNPNGFFTLGPGNPVVSGTIIDTDWANPTLADIANEITNSLSREGEGGMLVPLKFINGSMTNPGISWVNEIRTGFYLAGDEDMRVSVDGIDSLRWTPNGVFVWNIPLQQWEELEGGVQTALETPFDSGTYDNVQVALEAALTAVGTAYSGGSYNNVQAALGDALTAVGTLYNHVTYSNVKDALDDALTALGTLYNAADSALTAINVKGALDEIAGILEVLINSFNFRGTWDADLNLPDLLLIAKESGDFWVVTVPGTFALPDPDGGVIDSWIVGDRAVYLDIVGPPITQGWAKVPGTGDGTLARQVIFDPINFEANFTGTPPEQVQAALDFGWPILADADQSSIGDYSTTGSDFNILRKNIFRFLPNGSLNQPWIDFANVVLHLSSDSDQGGAQFTIALNNAGQQRAGFRGLQGGTFGPWQEIFHSTTITSVQAESLLDDVSKGGVPQTAISLSNTDNLNNIVTAGIYRQTTSANTPGNNYPEEQAGTLEVLFVNEGVLLFQRYTTNQTILTYIRNTISSGTTWTEWKLLGGEEGTFLPISGGTMTGQILGVTPLAAADLTRRDYVDTKALLAGASGQEFNASQLLINSTPPSQANHATRKDYVDAQINAADYLPLAGGTVTGQIKGIPPLAAEDLTRLDYVNSQIAAINFPVDTVFGRSGAVVAATSDYDALQVDYDNALTPDWPVTNVQDALVDAHDAIQFLAGAVVLKGVWDADLNIPDLLTISLLSGNYYIVSVEGSTVLPLFPTAPAHILPWLISDRVLYLDDGAGATGFAQLRPDTDEFLLLTGGSMLGQIVGVAPGPVAAGDLTRKDYIDGLIAGIPPAPVDSVHGRTGAVVAVPADYTPAFIGAATAAQGALADSALQPGLLDNVSELVNDAGYLTTTPAAPVDSVFGRTGIVTALAADYTPGFIGAALTAGDSAVPFNVGVATGAAHAARKEYVDSVAGGNVKLTGDQTIDGVKTFTSNPVGPAFTHNAAQSGSIDASTRKDYVDGQINTRLALSGGTLTGAMLIRKTSGGQPTLLLGETSTAANLALVGSNLPAGSFRIEANEAGDLKFQTADIDGGYSEDGDDIGSMVIMERSGKTNVRGTQGELVITSTTGVENQQSILVFMPIDSQQVQIRHNTFNGVRAPFGLIIEKAAGNDEPEELAYLEVEGKIYSEGQEVVKTKAGAVELSGVGDSASVTFGTPFPDANYAITIGEEASSGYEEGIRIFTKSATGFSLQSGTSTTILANWIAVPYND